jgi:hypothetical protein
MADGVTLTSLSVSLPQKISVATNHLYQIVLNQKLSRKYKKVVYILKPRYSEIMQQEITSNKTCL